MNRIAAALIALLLASPAWAQFQGPAAPYMGSTTGGFGTGGSCEITIGSTTIACGGTATTVTGLTLSGGTLSGTTTLTGITTGSVLFSGASSVLTQDNANLFWDDTNNRLGRGTATPLSDFESVSTSTSDPRGIYSTQIAASGSAVFATARSRGTPGSLSAVLSGDVLGTFQYRGYDGTNALNTAAANAAALRAVTVENWASGAHGTKLDFFTTPAGSGSQATRMTIKSDGNVDIGPNGIGAARLSVGGSAATAYTSNLDTDASNYERAYIGDWGAVANVATYGPTKGGTGTYRPGRWETGGLEIWRSRTNGDFQQGSGSALATNATGGFFLIASGAGAPTGVPANAAAGETPLYYDTTNNQLYVYNGGWKQPKTPAGAAIVTWQ